jgi:hypothetical protein
MNIDYWAHWVVSIIALIASIGIPIWQWRTTNAQTILNKRTLLLQGIVSAKSATYWTIHKMHLWILTLSKDKLRLEDQTKITNTLAGLQKLHDSFEALHREWSDREWSDYKELEKMISAVDAMASQAKDSARVAEGFTKKRSSN